MGFFSFSSDKEGSAEPDLVLHMNAQTNAVPVLIRVNYTNTEQGKHVRKLYSYYWIEIILSPHMQANALSPVGSSPLS